MEFCACTEITATISQHIDLIMSVFPVYQWCLLLLLMRLLHERVTTGNECYCCVNIAPLTCSLAVALRSTPSTTMSLPLTPTTLLPRFTASIAYSTWPNNRLHRRVPLALKGCLCCTTCSALRQCKE
jgi:hypothetical protein